MGTLTANQQRLPGQCEHKLPTSCRLSSIPECCACADERAHAAAYRTYVDGVGYVLRGTRWQRYCWFCKEFWSNRVEISGMSAPQTRIPTVPDQSDFLKRWYEFHQGYKTVTKEDGSEERVELEFEPFQHVSPGHLPRTTEEMARGAHHSAHDARSQNSSLTIAPTQVDQGPSLDDALNQLFEEADAEERAQASSDNPLNTPSPTNPLQHTNGIVGLPSIHAQAVTAPERQPNERTAQRLNLLQHELRRVSTGIERVMTSLAELGRHVPGQAEATAQMAQLSQTLAAITNEGTANHVNPPAQDQNVQDTASQQLERRVAETQEYLRMAERDRDRAYHELQLAEQEVRTAQHHVRRMRTERRTAENFRRVFGTREEMAADDWISPVGGLFDRAEERFRAAENVRREQRVLRGVLEQEAAETRQMTALEAARERSINQELDAHDIMIEADRNARQMEDDLGLARRNRLAQTDSGRMDLFGARPDNTRLASGEDMMLVGRELIADFTQTASESEPSQNLQHQGTSNTTQLMEMARDEVFAGQGSQDSPDQRPASQGSDMSTEHDSEVGQVYAQLRHNGWRQLARDQTDSSANVRFREMIRNNAASSESSADTTPARPGDNMSLRYRHIVPLHQRPRAAYELNNDNWMLDVKFIMTKLAEAPEGSELHSISGYSQTRARERLDEINDLGPSDVFSRGLHAELDRLLENEELVWGVALPAERMWRCRRHGSFLCFSEDPASTDREVRRQNIEAMAEAYKLSARIRDCTGQSFSDQMAMLDRIHREIRQPEDRAILGTLLRDESVFGRALRTFRPFMTQTDQDQEARVAEGLRARAREGVFTRQALDDSRRAQASQNAATHYGLRLPMSERVVEHASRTAGNGNHVRMDEQSLAALRASRPNNPPHPAELALRNFDINGTSSMHNELFGPLVDGTRTITDMARRLRGQDVEPSWAVGLDAEGTGRPTEAKTEEEKTFKLECRICYDQIAEIACLPCGHLAMCRWCSEQHSPTFQSDRTRPRASARCPICRKQIKSKVKIYGGDAVAERSNNS